MKDNNKKIIIAIIAVATLIVAIVGATFAFFSASGGSTNNAITANATTLANLGFTSSHSKIATELVPVASESPYFYRYPGIAASGEHSCLDDVGNQICSIYEFTITNTASVAQTIYISFAPSENTFDNMYFAAFNTSVASANYVVATGSSGSGNNFTLTPQTTTGNSTLGHQATKLTKNNTNPIDMPGLSTILSAGSSVTYTILVWLQETGNDQNTEQGGSFKAGVNVTTGGNSTGVTGIMGESENYVYTVSETQVSIGKSIPNGMVTYTTAASAMAEFGHNSFIRHKKVNSSGWCIIMNGDTTSCVYAASSESDCNTILQGAPNDGNTYSCSNIALNVITESYVGFVMNGTTYYLKGGDNGASYNANKATLLNAFGSTYCADHSSRVDCDVSGLYAYAIDAGNVNVRGDGFTCDVFDDGDSNCSEL